MEWLLFDQPLAGLHRQLRSQPCRVYPSGMRVLVSPTGLYTYSDVTAVCAAPRFLDDQRDRLLNPDLIVEVRSPSTEALYEKVELAV